MPVVDMLFCVAMAEAVSLMSTHGATISSREPLRAAEPAPSLGDAAMQDPFFCLRTSNLAPNVALDRDPAPFRAAMVLARGTPAGSAISKSGVAGRGLAASDW